MNNESMTAKIAALIILMVLTSLQTFAQHTLKITIHEINSNNGAIILELSLNEEVLMEGLAGEIFNNECTIVIDSLQSGTYSFRYFHDENGNNKLDTYWLGVPKEGYGYSNNASGKFGPPAVKKTVFELQNDTLVYCKPEYFEF